MIKFNVQVCASVDAFFVVEAQNEAAALQIAAELYDDVGPFELCEDIDPEDFLWSHDFSKALVRIEPEEGDAKEGE